MAITRRMRGGAARGMAAAAVLLLGACGNGGIFPTIGIGGGPSGESAPMGSGEGRYQVGKPYTINGMSFTPREDYNYSAVGLASWYGPKYHGRQTANGEIYDMYKLTAAHPTLPLPSIVRVTNLENGSQLDLRVNDRGPFIPGRILDVSKAAADRLGFKTAGVTHVRVDILAAESKRLKQAMLNGGGNRSVAQAPTQFMQPAFADTRQVASRPAPGFMTASASGPQIAMSAPAPSAAPVGGKIAVKPLEPIMPQASAPPARANVSQAERGVITPGPAAPTPAPEQPGFATQDDLPAAWTTPPAETLPKAVAASSRIEVAAPIEEPEALPPLDVSASIEPIRPSQTLKPYAAPMSVTADSGMFVQAGAFGDADKAKLIKERLASFGPSLVAPVTTAGGRELYRVRVGPFNDRASADRMRAQVAASGFPDALTIAPTAVRPGGGGPGPVRRR